ncbi:MAG: hypothetical protein WA982_11910 [Rubrobacteraceae bacterium]
MAQSVMQKIEELSEEREKILSRDGTHHAEPGDHERLQTIDHDLKVLWDLRRREMSGENVDLDSDFYDRYDRYTGSDGPG